MGSKENSTADGSEILIVEDSPTQAMELEFILHQNGYRTSVAQNGREALAWLSRKTPAMVISDIVMPELDGFELCRAIRANLKLRPIPVILLSFLSDEADVLKGLESGASNFIIKPYNHAHLVSCIQEKLSRDAAEEDRPQPPVTVEYSGKGYTINSGVRQVLDILVSTYGTVVSKNAELIRAEAEREHVLEEREKLIAELQEALANVKTLSGLLPICAWCKKIRDDKGDWHEIQNYMCDHSEASLTHGICPECYRKVREEEETQ
ncbi:MAG: response regulator [Syntrophobacteraceae bacterium]|jgi:two-component system cell cycle response regulator